MVATTYTWVLNQKVVITQSINTVEACNQDRALLMDIRKRNMINITTIILIFMGLEPLNCCPAVHETEYQLTNSKNTNSQNTNSQQLIPTQW